MDSSGTVCLSGRAVSMEEAVAVLPQMFCHLGAGGSTCAACLTQGPSPEQRSALRSSQA